MCVYGFNYARLQSKMNSVINSDARNNGVKVSVHFGHFINTSVLVYDLRSISDSNSIADAFRVFLQFADKSQSEQFEIIELAHKGITKFKIPGDYFQTLGKEYAWQNPVYTMRTFPGHLRRPDGSQAYSEWEGGLLGVATAQVEDFNDFHRKWYIDDSLSK